MPDHTTNYNLEKPITTEKYNIAVQNGNMDIVDTELKKLSDLVTIKQNITIVSANWLDDTATSGFWIYDIVDADITVNTVVDVNIHLSDLENAGALKSVTESFNGYARIYASTQPNTDLTVDLKSIKAVV